MDISSSILHVNVFMGVSMMCSSFVKMGLWNFGWSNGYWKYIKKLVSLPIWNARRYMTHIWLWNHSQLYPIGSTKLRKVFFTSTSFLHIYNSMQYSYEMSHQLQICSYLGSSSLSFRWWKNGHAKLRSYHAPICSTKETFPMIVISYEIVMDDKRFLAKYK